MPLMMLLLCMRNSLLCFKCLGQGLATPPPPKLPYMWHSHSLMSFSPSPFSVMAPLSPITECERLHSLCFFSVQVQPFTNVVIFTPLAFAFKFFTWIPLSIQEFILCCLKHHTIFKLCSLRVFSHEAAWHWVALGNKGRKENNGSVHLDHLMKDGCLHQRRQSSLIVDVVHNLFNTISSIFCPNRVLIPLTQWPLNDNCVIFCIEVVVEGGQSPFSSLNI